MMEVLKYKKPKHMEDKKYIKKCYNCKSVLIYNKDDLFPDMEMDLCIKCPICNKYNYIGLFHKRYKPEKHGKIKE